MSGMMMVVYITPQQSITAYNHTTPNFTVPISSIGKLITNTNSIMTASCALGDTMSSANTINTDSNHIDDKNGNSSNSSCNDNNVENTNNTDDTERLDIYKLKIDKQIFFAVVEYGRKQTYANTVFHRLLR